MSKLECIELPIISLKPRASNPRTHNRRQRRQIASAIRRWGFTNPILIDENREIIAGHGRLEAAKMLGYETVPTICLANMSEADKRAYVIADNRLAELAGWDNELLAIEFQYLSEIEIDFDLTITGFDMPAIDLLIDGISNTDLDRLETLHEPSGGMCISSPGDIWVCGDHLVHCGNAADRTAYELLLAGDSAQIVFTDPPYNVPIDGNVCGLGTVRHREFAMASGEMTESQFIGFLSRVFQLLVAHTVDGSIHFTCMDWRHVYELVCAGRSTYAELKNICVWNKTNGGMGSLYRCKHELVAVFKNGTAPHVNNIELGRHGRNRTNVWDYPGISSLHADRAKELSMHPTVKPVAMVADALLDCSNRGDVVLDCFGGSGTTLIAAERTGRRARVMEIDPAYVDVTIRRYQKFTGNPARLAGGDLTFDDLASVLVGDGEKTHVA